MFLSKLFERCVTLGILRCWEISWKFSGQIVTYISDLFTSVYFYGKLQANDFSRFHV